MENFVYAEGLSSLVQIVVLGFILSLPVCYTVEKLKETGIKQSWFYVISSMLVSIAYAWGFGSFATLSIGEIGWLSVFLWLGSQGFYEVLSKSDGWIGKAFVSLSEKYDVKLPEIVEIAKPKEEVKEEIAVTPIPEELPKLEAALPVPELKEEEAVKMPTIEEEDTGEEFHPDLPKGEKRKTDTDQVKILVSDLRVRTKPSLKGEIIGYAEKNDYHTFTEVVEADGIKWYNIGGVYVGDSGAKDLVVCPADDYMIYPLEKFVAITTKYSKSHPAHDYGWNRNYGGSTQTIVAPYDMTVVKAGYDSTIGNYIYAQSTYEGQKLTFRFIHLSKILVEKGQKVTRGTKIAKMGNTGTSSNGAHLHFDILEGHRTSLPSKRYENSKDPIKMCYVPEGVTIAEDTKKVYTLLKA